MEYRTGSLAAAILNGLARSPEIAKLDRKLQYSLFNQGDAADSIYFVESGLIKIYQQREDGRRVILHIIAPGEILGEECLGDQALRTTAAEVMRDGTIYVIPRDAFISFCGSRTELWIRVVELIASRNKALEIRIELLRSRDVEFRILHCMAELASRLGTAIPVSQSEIAEMIGATRETTSTTLNVLERRGLLRLGRLQVLVPSLDQVLSAVHRDRVKAVVAG